MTDNELQARVDLAAAFRWAARLGMKEGVANHFSYALTDDGQEFLVNPHGLHFSEVTASNLFRVHADRRVLSREGEPDPTARYIHGRMHVGIPRARCIMHTHMRADTHGMVGMPIKPEKSSEGASTSIKAVGRTRATDAFDADHVVAGGSPPR